MRPTRMTGYILVLFKSRPKSIKEFNMKIQRKINKWLWKFFHRPWSRVRYGLHNNTVFIRLYTIIYILYYYIRIICIFLYFANGIKLRDQKFVSRRYTFDNWLPLLLRPLPLGTDIKAHSCQIIIHNELAEGAPVGKRDRDRVRRPEKRSCKCGWPHEIWVSTVDDNSNAQKAAVIDWWFRLLCVILKIVSVLFQYIIIACRFCFALHLLSEYQSPSHLLYDLCDGKLDSINNFDCVDCFAH